MPHHGEKKDTVLSAFFECKSSLVRYIKRYIGKKDDPEDILQEAFFRTYRANEKGNIQFPKTYMFKTAKNLAIREKTKMAARLTEYIEDYSGPAFSNNEPSAFDALEKKQNQQLLIAALDTLPSKCRTATVMRLIYGMPLKEIANEMGITVSTTEKHIAKGLERCETYVRLHIDSNDINKMAVATGNRTFGVSGDD